MKNLTTILGIAIFSLSLLACSQKEDDMYAEKISQMHRLSVDDVRSKYENTVPYLKNKTRCEDNNNQLIQSDYFVNWDQSIFSSDAGTESIEIQVVGPKKLMAQWGDGGVVNICQRLIAVIDFNDTKPNMLIETLIPSVEIYTKHPNDFDKLFTNCNWKTREFSGIAMLHTINGGFIRIARVEKGVLTSSYCAYYDWMENNFAKVIAEVESIMKGTKIYQSTTITRAGKIFNGGTIPPVIITGEPTCWNCGKRICNCTFGPITHQYVSSSWLNMYNNDLIFAGGSGGGGGYSEDDNGGGTSFDAELTKEQLEKVLLRLGSKSTIDLTWFFKGGVTSSTNNYVNGVIGGVHVFINQISMSGPYPQSTGTYVVYTEPSAWSYPNLPGGYDGVTMTYYSPNENCYMTITMRKSEYDKLPNYLK